MVEIAICLAIIGIALVSIIGVLPIGMNTQRDNREETIINQDATILMEAIRGGARGMDDLTNYVYAITNFWTKYDDKGAVLNSGADGHTNSPDLLTNGMNIVGMLSTPEFLHPTTLNPINSLFGGGYSNHIVAYVRSMSGPAIEKPLQDNDLVRGDSFGYRLLCVNAPIQSGPVPPIWQAQAYNQGDQVYWNYKIWQARGATTASDVPGTASDWSPLNYGTDLSANLHEIRLTFFWPQQPNGSLGPGRQTFRTLIAGQVTRDPILTNLYFYASQSFVNVTNAP